MDRNIKIEIKDRIARLVENPKIICNNNDYSVTFAFDDEWAGINFKTLRVSYNNKYSDHVFTGDTVKLPPITKAVEIYLGVFAADITSTKVVIRAEPSILSVSGSIEKPEPDVYNQLIDLINSMKPSGDKYELLGTITITEDNEGIDLINVNYGNLAAAYVIGTIPVRGVSQNVYARFYFPNGVRLMCGGMADARSYTNGVRLKARQVSGIWDAEAEIGVSTGSGTKYGQVGDALYSTENNKYISEIDIYTFPDSVSGGFIKGTKFDIWGVRANA